MCDEHPGLIPAVRQALLFPFLDESKRPGYSCTVIGWRLETPSSTFLPLTAVLNWQIRKEAKAVSHSIFCPYLFLIDLSVSGNIRIHYKQYFLERWELSPLQF